ARAAGRAAEGGAGVEHGGAADGAGGVVAAARRPARSTTDIAAGAPGRGNSAAAGGAGAGGNAPGGAGAARGSWAVPAAGAVRGRGVRRDGDPVRTLGRVQRGVEVEGGSVSRRDAMRLTGAYFGRAGGTSTGFVPSSPDAPVFAFICSASSNGSGMVNRT